MVHRNLKVATELCERSTKDGGDGGQVGFCFFGALIIAFVLSVVLDRLRGGGGGGA